MSHTTVPVSTKPRPKPVPIPKDAVQGKKAPPPKMPTEEEVSLAESVMSCINVNRSNFMQMSQAVQNYFAQVMKTKGQDEAFSVMKAADVLRRFAIASAPPQHGTAPCLGSTKPEPPNKHDLITQSGCFKLTDGFKIGQEGLVVPPTVATRQPSTERASSSDRDPLSPEPLDRSLSSPLIPHVSSLKSMHLSELANVRLLGQGAQGKVWLKRWTKTGDLFAVKELTITKAMDKKQQEHVSAELRALIHAPSDFIVPLYQAFLVSTTLTIVQQYMDLGSLEDLLKTHPRLPECCVASILSQLFEALREMSAVRKQLHRDIKPANILLSRAGEVKLADFGVASNLKTIGESSFIGTTTYMSPERIKGERYSLPSDVWAVGLVASQCLLGQYPFKYTTFFELLNSITTTDTLQLPTGTPDDLAEILRECLIQVPEERITCEKALASPFLQRHAAIHRKDFSDWITTNVPEVSS